MKKTSLLIQICIGLIPLIYLKVIWNELPSRVPLHFNSQSVADRFGSKTEFMVTLCMLFAISIGTSALITNLNKIDPKGSYTSANTLTTKIAFTIVIFLSVISCGVVYSVANYSNGTVIPSKIVLLLICLLFVALGNFMNNVKPNYFVGIRTPWNLEDSENWRKTHHLGSKVWFFGGLVMFFLLLALPASFSIYVFFVGLIVLCVVPFFYSYTLFKDKTSGLSEQRKS